MSVARGSSSSTTATSSAAAQRNNRQKSVPAAFQDPLSPRVPYFERYPLGKERRPSTASSLASPSSAAASPKSSSLRSASRTAPPIVSQHMEPIAFPTSESHVSTHDIDRSMRSRTASSPNSPSTYGNRFSVSSSLTQTTTVTYSPPRTPPHELFEPSRVSVIAPISGVETMDALVDGMNGDSSFNSDMFSIPSHSSRKSKSKSDRKGMLPSWQDPLYQPPLPEPPPGVRLGGRLPPSSSRPTNRSRSATTDGATHSTSTRRHHRRHSSSDEDEPLNEVETVNFRPTQRRPSDTFQSRIPVYSSLPPRRASLTRQPSSSLESRTAPVLLPASKAAPPTPPSASRPSASTSRPTPAQQIAAASRAKSSATSAPRSSSRPPPSSSHSQPSEPVRPSSRKKREDRDGSRDINSSMSRQRTRSNPGDDTDAANHHQSSTSSASGSRYTTASSSPADSTVPLPALPRKASNVSLGGRKVHHSPSSPKAEIVPSITEIIRTHAPEIAASRERARAQHGVRAAPDHHSPYMNSRPSVASQSSGSGFGTLIEGNFSRGRVDDVDELGMYKGRRSNSVRDPNGRSHEFFANRKIPEDDISSTRSSMDSIALEAETTLKSAELHWEYERMRTERHGLPTTPVSANTIVSFGSAITSKGLGSNSTKVVREPMSDLRHRRPSTSSRPETLDKSPGVVPFPSAANATASPRVVGQTRDKSKDTALHLASYLRSPRLTKILTLHRQPHSSNLPGRAKLQVSLSDVGRETGHPVVVFLGLGGVRYITALYDEMANALNLRLICIDRWGVGKTSEPVPGSQRGVSEWACAVEEVLAQLDITYCSVLGHSAGAPYAMAFAQRMGARVHGEVCLLAPWVAEAAGYKWLKYVPNALVKTAQAAEWKMQGWKLGKPPALAFDGIGFDANAEEVASPEAGRRPSFAGSFLSSEYDDLADFNGKFDSGSTVNFANPADRAVPKRKTSKGFLSGLLKGGNSASAAQPPARAASLSSNSPAPRLKGLKSMGSLKGRSDSQSQQRQRTISTATSATSGTAATSNVLPEVPSLHGLGFDWAELKNNSGPATAPAGSAGLDLSDSMLSAGRPGSEKSRFSPITPLTPNDSLRGSIKGNELDKEKDRELSMASALLAASHAESSKALNADLLVILNHERKSWGFSYQGFSHPVKVWHGDRDEKIGEPAVRWMEKVMKRCEVKIIKGAGHNLMTNPKVVVEAMEWICEAWDRD